MDLNAKRYSTKWFEYKLEDETLRFKLQYYPDSVRERLQKECTFQKNDGTEETDFIKFGELAIDHMIQDWEGIKQKCTKQNKVKLVESHPAISEWAAMTCQWRLAFAPSLESVLGNYGGLSNTRENGQSQKVETNPV